MPALTAVLRDVDEAVVGATPDDVDILVRRRNRVDDAAACLLGLLRRAKDADVVGYIRCLTRQFRADDLPFLTAIGRLEQNIGPEEKYVRIDRGNQKRL